MKDLFYECSSLKELDISKFNTDNVTDMSYMFYNCSSLKRLNISNFNTGNVTNMSYMFYNCSSLKKLEISNFNIEKVTALSYMFYGCSSLNEIIFSSSSIEINNISKEDAEGVCDKCPKLKSVSMPIYDISPIFKFSYSKINLKIFII